MRILSACLSWGVFPEQEKGVQVAQQVLALSPCMYVYSEKCTYTFIIPLMKAICSHHVANSEETQEVAQITTVQQSNYIDYSYLCKEHKHIHRFPLTQDNLWSIVTRPWSSHQHFTQSSAHKAACLCWIPKRHHHSPCVAGTGCEVSNAS